jgi:ComF family protein
MTGKGIISFWSRVIDMISPRACAVCGRRLSIDERQLCCKCNLHMPRTFFARKPLDNEMARMLWGQIPVERAAALFYYETGSELTHLIHQMKYGDSPQTGEDLGRMVATEMALDGFFDGVDMLIPVPLTSERQRERGYNQSMELARGIATVTGLTVGKGVLRRTKFSGSQTHIRGRERRNNVEDAFSLADGTSIAHRHVMIVDDVMTTGATIINCAKELLKAGDVTISVVTVGFTKN